VHPAPDDRRGDALRALVVTHYWHPHLGGIETVARHHVRELASKGWSCEVHTTRVPRRSSRAVDGTCETFEVVRHAAANPLERSVAVPVPIPAPGLTRALVAAARRADVVIAHGHVYPTSVCALVAARRTARPFVLVQHNPWVDYPTPIEMVERAADLAIGRRVIRAARVVVCVSRHTEAYVRSIAPTARTIVIHNGVDTTLFRPADDCRPRRRFVCVRRLVPRNGVGTLLAAWRSAGLEGWELVIVGDGSSRAMLERDAGDLDGVEFRRRLPSDELAELIRTAWATVVPTTSGEGFGLVAAESQACGTPVIAARQGALVEVVRDGVDGVLVEAGSPPQLAAAIRGLAQDAQYRARLGEGCRRRDRSWSGPSAELDRVLRSVATEAGADH
jgi:D-inositol-3-phosphate glycosyltransferase